jgi:hypothetical protein
MSSKVVPTMFDTGKREDIPKVEPEKRVGGGEYTTPTPNNEELLEDSGLWGKSLNAIGIKTLSQERKEESKRKAEKLTKANVPTTGDEPKPFHERFMSMEENPLLKNMGSSDIKAITGGNSNEVKFDGKEAMSRTARAMGVQGDFSNLSEKDVGDIAKIAENFAKTAQYNDAATSFGVLGRVSDGVVEYTKAGNNATGVAGLLGTLSGESAVWDYMDLGAEAAFAHALIQKAIEWNIPSYIDKLTGLIYNNELQQISLEQNLSLAAQQSNLTMFKELYKHLDGDRKSRLRDRYLRELIQYFKLENGADKKSKAEELLSTMDMVSSNWRDDPDGFKTKAGDPMPYAYYFSFGSTDAIEAIEYTEHWRLALIGSLVEAKTSQQLVRQTLPALQL